MPRISVIIPVYNTEKYLPRCLDSVINQTLDDIEIICINDCSTDSSLNILKEYAARDNRIKLIDLPQNKGAANARNIGISDSNGEYIGFIDSDDYIDVDFYEKLYKKAAETSSDIIKGADLKILKTDGNTEIETQNDLIKKDKINFIHGFTTAIYKSGFIKDNKITFPLLLLGEDPVFTVKTALLSKSIEVVNNAQYYYVKNKNSLNSDIWDKDKLEGYCKHIEMITDFALTQNLPPDRYKHFFGKILQDIVHINENKTISVKNSDKILNNLYKSILKKTFKYPIRILFDATIFITVSDINNKRGIYYVAYNLIKKFISDERFKVVLWLEKNYDTNIIKSDILLKNLRIMYSNFVINGKNGVRTVINPLFNMYDYDAYINVSHHCQLCTNKRPAVFNVIHDVIPLIMPETLDNNYEKIFYDFYDALSDQVHGFCVSQNTKDGFLKYFKKLDKNNLDVTYIAASNNFCPLYNKPKLQKTLKKYKINHTDNKYIFYLGAIYDKRKNLTLTIKCFLQFIKKYNIKDLYFYLGGAGKELIINYLSNKLGSLYDELKEYIVFLGFVDDEDVNILYSNSLFFSFLPLYEGFGIPPLEAMQAGTPVICSNNSSIPEVVGNAAILVNPQDEAEIIDAFSKLYYDENLRKELIQKGLEQAKMFNWNKTYKLMSDKIIKVVSGEI